MKTLDLKAAAGPGRGDPGAKLRACRPAPHITQSAISQRIKQLEQQLRAAHHPQPAAAGHGARPEAAGPLSPGAPAGLGWPASSPRQARGPIRVSIAVNADSLATWFCPPWHPLLEQYPIRLNLLVDDESRTLDRVREGQAFGAVSLQAPAAGGLLRRRTRRDALSAHRQPAFVARHFPNGLTAAAWPRRAGGGLRSARRHAHQLHGPSFRPPRWLPLPHGAILRAFVAMAERGAAASSRNCRSASNWKRGACSISAGSPPGRAALLAPLGAGQGLHKQISQRLIQQGDGHCNPLGPFTLALG